MLFGNISNDAEDNDADDVVNDVPVNTSYKQVLVDIISMFQVL